MNAMKGASQLSLVLLSSRGFIACVMGAIIRRDQTRQVLVGWILQVEGLKVLRLLEMVQAVSFGFGQGLSPKSRAVPALREPPPSRVQEHAIHLPQSLCD